jgi:hypothetical protein
VQPCPRSPAGEYAAAGIEYDGPFTDMMSGKDSHWRKDGTCSYCGSLNNDYFMERLEKGDVECGPTDKSYKVYVVNAGGEPLPTPGKFYFQHLTRDQMQRFVEMANGGLIAMGYPGHFYTLPFFIRRADKCEQDS